MNDFLAQLRERLPFIIAIAATTVWVVVAVVFIRSIGGLAALQVLAPADLAVLIAAVAGPVAALWLIMAVLEQRRALQHFTRRMAEMAMQHRQSLQQAESQTRTLLQLQAQTARAQILETRRLALQDMAASVSVLAERLGVMNREGAHAAWMLYGAGDVNVFVQAFLSFAVSHPDIAARMAEAVVRDPVAGTALASFVRRYERLSAASTDDKMALEIFDDGALGRAYRLFKNADEQAAKLQTPAVKAPPPQPAAPQPAPPQVETPQPETLKAPSSKAGGDTAPMSDPAVVQRLTDLFERLEAASPKN
ncbi:MAG: hypothetical protein K2P94_05335 [Rhodospirillaceae bacterium]|nr:hypothetical protein [Rhodospirillaceae bacterium]